MLIRVQPVLVHHTDLAFQDARSRQGRQLIDSKPADVEGFQRVWGAAVIDDIA